MFVSFVIPAHNEEALIGATVAAILRAAGEAGIQHEVVVVDDSSDDRTGEIARTAGAHVVRIESKQISLSRNAGAAAAIGDAFIFVDADTIVTADAVRGAVKAMQAGAVGGGAHAKFDEPTPFWARMMLPLVLLIYRVFKLATGCFLFCTRQAFEATAGFDSTLFAGEEVEMSKALSRQGKMVMLRESVTTSGRKLRTHSAFSVVMIFVRLAIRGRSSVSKREGLEFWYGPRKDDSRGD